MKKGKRICSFLLAICMMIIMMPTSFAANGMDKTVFVGKRNFIWPVPGWTNIMSCYLDPDAVTNGERSSNHYALDISASTGTSVVASYAGTVEKAVYGGSSSYYGDGFGNYVVIRHNNYQLASGKTITLYTRYSHLSSVSVQQGAKVSAGQTIGKVGESGAAYGPHLDFQILRNTWTDRATNGLDPYANQLLELPAGLSVTATTSCCKTYVNNVKNNYNNAKISVSINPTLQKTNMNVGDTCIVGGTVSATGSAIKTVKAGIYTSSNGSGCVNGIETTRTVNAYSYNLSNVDSVMYFNHIPSGGTYYFVVTATLQNGTTKTESRKFTVNGKTCSSPSISFTDINGGKTLTIQGGSSDTVNYTITRDGTKISSGSSSGSYTTNLTTAGNYSVSATCSRSGYTTSSATTKSANIIQVQMPEIKQSLAGDGIRLNMSSGTSGAVIYYTTSGNTPTISSSKYTGTISVTTEKTIKAIAVKNGCVNSEIAVAVTKLEEPGKTTGFSMTNEAKIPVGDNVSLQWDANPAASGYVVEVFKDNEELEAVKTTGTVLSYNLSQVGAYQFKLYATNFVGNSEASDTVLDVEAMNPCTVNFVDWDGTLIKSQEVPYGKDAVLPADPERKGYSFLSWENGDKITNVTENLTITAQYKINTYVVKFYDASGTQVGSTQKVKYLESAASPEKELTDIPTGYIFAGWKVIESAADSTGDYKAVDSDLKLQAVYYWENDDLPIVCEITSATRNTETGNYNIEVKLTNYPTQATTAILRTCLVTSEGKMVKTGKQEIEIAADGTLETNITLKYSGVATKAEVTVLGINGDNLTGSATSKLVSKEVTELSDMVWTEWSDWTTTKPEEEEGVEIEEKTQYRYADKMTTTSSSSSLSGWELYDTTSSWSDWGSWSSWSGTAQTASDSKQVETRTEYRYYYYYCPVCGGREPLQGKSDCGKYTLSSSNWNEGWFPTAYKSSNSSTYSYATYKRYTTSLGDGKRWNFSSGNLNSTAVGTKDSDSDAIVIRTGYRYRTRTLHYTYYYYKWSDWSEWGDTPYTANDNRKVETRTVYRTRKQVPVYSELAGSEETGTPYEFSGNLSSVNTNLNGKLATVMVYKGKNTDPNEDQIQYVGQIVIGENNSYSMTIIPREEPTALTGDYTVCLGIEGSTGLINVASIEAPKNKYTVAYFSDDEQLSTQVVEEGGNAVVPEKPSKAGYRFIGWSENAINVQNDMSITAQFEPIQYTVVFVDSLNSTVSFESYLYGDTIIPPNTADVEGYSFVGWDCILENRNIVTENMVAYAVYDAETYIVNFVDENDNVISSQKVEYGKSASLPAALDVEGKEFLGWSTAETWWNVTKDMTVEPIMIYLNTVEQPTYNVVLYDDYAALYLESETEDADIYYTLDGTSPTTESEKYDGVIILEDFDEEDTYDDTKKTLTHHLVANVNAIAVCDEMNDSEVQAISIAEELIEDISSYMDELAIASQPEDYTGAVGTTAKFTVAATGDSLTYQWQYSNNGTNWYASSQDGAKTETLSVPITESRDGQQYRCVVTDGSGNSVTSNAAKIIVGTATVELAITSQPEDYTGAVGTTAKFTVAATGDSLTYQWQYSNNGTNWYASSQDGAKTETLSVPITESRDGQQYRCVVTDGSGNSVTSNTAKIIVS